MRVADFESIRIKIASPEDILSWSQGEVTRAETINYRTQRPEKDGLFCEKIFGPIKDFECSCGKYKRVRYKGVICDKCGVEVTKSSVRRERIGHIKLACPCSHIWFLRGMPSSISICLNIQESLLEGVIYFVNYIITNVDKEAKDKILKEIEKEYQQKLKNQNIDISANKKTNENKLTKTQKSKTEEIEKLKKLRDSAKNEVLSIQPLKVISEIEYHNLSLKYGQIFEAGTGAETLRKICENLNLRKISKDIEKELQKKCSTSEKIKKLRRLRIIRGMEKAKIRPEWMFLTVLPVIPPDLRPMVQLSGGRYASSDLNDLYRRVINRNNRLKYLLDLSSPEVIVRNEKRMLQEAVDALIDNTMRRGTTTQASTGGRRLLKSLSDILKGKQGRFRQNLLGKRVDYSGRSVIVVGPNLKLNQCGLPKKMALNMLKPHVIKKILDKELAYNIKGASRLIEEETSEVWTILEEVIKNKFVLLNRAPTLHRLGIQAFRPVLVEGEAIRLHPLVCNSFNADFDGDTMAVHLPLSTNAQKEAKEIMLSSLNLLKPSTGIPVVSPTKDIVLGCYWITQIKENALGQGKLFSSKNEAMLAYDTGAIDLRAKIKIRFSYSQLYPKSEEKKPSERQDFNNGFLETTVGRIIFNRTLPDNFGFINQSMNSKKLEKITAEVIKNFSNKSAMEYLDKVKDLGFEYSSFSGITWSMGDLITPSEKVKLIKEAEKSVEIIENHYKKGLLSKEEKRSQIIEVWQRTKSEIEKLVPKSLPSLGPVFSIVDSGARGSWSQPVQMSGMKGLVINPAGRIIDLPVKHSYKEGLDVLEYFISTHGARKGGTDTALRTSTAGYLTRRLVDVSHDVIIKEKDCGDKQGTIVSLKDAKSINQNFIFKIVGRISMDRIENQGKIIIEAGEMICWNKAEEIIQAGIENVRVRSPLSCKSKKSVCQKCYGWHLGLNKLVELGSAVGVLAAQSIGEPGVQLTMRTFHTGGVAGARDITKGLPRVEEIFECRMPKGKAVISMCEGQVKEIDKQEIVKIKIKKIENKKTADQKEKSEKKKISKKDAKDIIEYKIPAGAGLWVEKNQIIKKGQQLCEGSLDLKELFLTTDMETTKKYIVNQIQEIYASQGATIHDKHIEVIVRQMFSKFKVIDKGDSFLLQGEVIGQEKLNSIQKELKKEKKKPVKIEPILLGISKVALATNSWLSAASFQETSRVLINASLQGKEDKLLGLKENVIIGKLIPCGTGFKK